MDIEKKKQDPTLVCTCNELYIDDIQNAIDDGESEYQEIMQYNDTLPRCGECECHVEYLVTGDNSQCQIDEWICGENCT
ncbi:(2Fe-2S)-binding protein [Neptuniibacter sp. PT34_22]|uniref:(2Fe-2S)-binding protein n=1 Tax=Neptuniibacter sp. PT34_22 TaxID=3398205 RepID=UPI0039F5981D